MSSPTSIAEPKLKIDKHGYAYYLDDKYNVIPNPQDYLDGFLIFTKSQCFQCHEFKKSLEDEPHTAYIYNSDKHLEQDRPLFKSTIINYIMQSTNIILPDMNQSNQDVINAQQQLNLFKRSYNPTHLDKTLSFPIVFYAGCYINSPYSFLHELSDAIHYLRDDEEVF